MATLFLILICLQSENPSTTPTIDPAPFVAAFQELDQLLSQDQEPLWGMPLDSALIMVDPVSRLAFCNRPLVNEWFEPHQKIWKGTLPLGPDISQEKLRWAGHALPLIQIPLPTKEIERAQLMILGIWRARAEQLGLNTRFVKNAHLRQVEARIWMRLEWRALAKALQSKGLSQRAAVADAITFRRHRRSLSQEAAIEEQISEMHLGLAAYTALKLHAQENAIAQLVDLLPQWESHPNYAQSFAQWSGPAYGLLLDQFRPDWRQQINDRQDLALMLEIGMKLIIPQAWYDAASLRAQPYRMAQIRREEEAQAERSAKRLAELRAKFVKAPILELGLQVSIDPNQIEGSLSLEHDGFWVPGLSLNSQWGTLELSQGARIQGSKIYLALPLQEEESQLSGPGWTLQRKELWKIQPGERVGDLILIVPKEEEEPP